MINNVGASGKFFPNKSYREVQNKNLESVNKHRAYYNSGAKWLGEVPTQWSVRKIKYMFRDVSIKNRSDEELLSVTQDQGVVPRTWVENRMVMPSGNLDSFKFIKKGDFAISLRSFEGGLEYCHHDGIVSPAYTVLKSSATIDSSYFRYLFKSKSFISEIQTSVVGIREGKNISYPELSYSLLPVPPLSEQTAIANFLDRKTALIDRAIAQQERLIELLRERKQIVIQRAVTRGLDAGVAMKDSGVEWIGEVPEHWNVSKIKHYVQILPGYAFTSSDFVDSRVGIRLLRGINVKTDGIDWDETVYWPADNIDGLERYILKKGDIVMGMDRPWISFGIRVVKVEENDTPSLLVQRVCRLRSITGLRQLYLLCLLRTKLFYSHFAPMLTGISVPHISEAQIGNFICAIPPLKEQDEILKLLDTLSSKIDKAIRKHSTQITKLKEYRATLIDAAVTGKIKVT
jgi:type I restriction enzyme S subunit